MNFMREKIGLDPKKEINILQVKDAIVFLH